MRITHWFKYFYHSRLGLPLLLPLILMPLCTQLSIRLWMADGYVYLIYLPLAMLVAMLLVYDWAAFPGIALGLASYYFFRYNLLTASVIVAVFLTVLMLCWAGYRLHSRQRWGVDYGEFRMMSVRLFWLAFMTPTLFVFTMHVMTLLGLTPFNHSVFSRSALSLHTLLNYQSVLLSCLVMIQLCYFVIRSIRKPAFISLLARRAVRQMATGVSKAELTLWAGLLIFLLGVQLQFEQADENLLNTDYGLPLFLPLMLWSAVRFGYLITSLSWAMLLLCIYQLRDRFLSPETDPHHLAVISVNMLVFTLTILLMASISTRQRFALARVKRASLSDPVFRLPNLRALAQDLAESPRSTLCFLSIPDLDRLSRTYGLQMRIQYKRSLAIHLMPELQPGEDVYQLPGFDLVMRLNYDHHVERIENVAVRLKDYQLSWDGLPIHPAVGLSYCSVRPPVNHLHELLGELSAMAEVSLRSGVAENLQQRRGQTAQRQVAEKIALLNDTQTALKHGGFQLMVQKIAGVRGDDYYEIRPQMADRYGGWVEYSRLIPVINEFGLTWEADRQVIMMALAFIQRHREKLPGVRFAIRLFASSLCRPQLARELQVFMQEYGVEPWQLIIEVEESPMLTDYSWGNRSITQLRHLGCRLAINNFGSGYASYNQLEEVQMDMLKISPTFVSNMLSSSLNYQIIESICMIARLKRMQVIASGVESEEAERLLRLLGVDYLQGDFISQPCALQDLCESVEPIPPTKPDEDPSPQ